MKSDYEFLIIAGEASADSHGAALIAELKKQQPACTFWGIGGDALQKQGVRLMIHMKQMAFAFLGVGEVVRHLPFIRKVFRDITNAARQSKPRAAILIDYPGFNLRLAKKLHNMGIPVIYYISPQLWAWGKRRVRKIRRYVDLMLVLFPFEREFYRQHGIEAHYVGHPLVDHHYRFLPEHIKTTATDNITIGLLPGSRVNEINSLLPRMLQTARLLKQRGMIRKAEIIKAEHIDEALIRGLLRPDDAFVSVREEPLSRVLPGYDAVIVASGTATLECAYYAVPMLIVYQVHPVTFWLAKALVKIKYIGLANIVAEKEVARELIQKDFTPEKAAEYLTEILQPEKNQMLRQALLEVRERLGAPGASKRAAEHILDYLAQS